MDEYLALFPYTAAAARYVEASGRTFDSLMTAGEFSDSVLNKSVQRVAQAIDSDVHSKPLERDDDEMSSSLTSWEGRWSLAFANLCWFRDMQMPKPTTHLPSCGTLANDFRMSTLQGCWGT